MNKKLNILIMLLVFMLFFFISECYSQDSGEDEQIFQEIAKETDVFILEAAKLDEELSDEDYKEEVQKQQARLNRIVNGLRRFIIDYPESRYVDDAAYILTRFWGYTPGQYVEEARLFLRKYPNASLEDWTLNNVEFIVFPKQIGVINTIKTKIFTTLYHLRRYEESIEETRQFIDNLDTQKLTKEGFRILALGYYYLMKGHEAQGDNEKVKQVCEEAIKKLRSRKDRADFVKKLKELKSKR